MKRISTQIIAMLMAVFFLSTNIFASDFNGEDGDAGGVFVGGGTDENYWGQVLNSRGDYGYPDGLRVYVANASTGAPVSSVVDITNYRIGTSVRNGYNGRKLTKYDYLYGSTLTVTDRQYDYTLINTSPDLLPRIVHSSSGSGRIEQMKEWFLNPYYGAWVLSQLGTDLIAMHEKTADDKPKYKLIFEPILYFYMGGNLYGLTATEAALLNIQTSNGVSSSLGRVLIRQNLPLSVFLERSEFNGTMPAWAGSISEPASNEDIVNYLGIGTVTYTENGGDGDGGGGGVVIDSPVITGTHSLSYPADTWVMTSVTLNNLSGYNGTAWESDTRKALSNPATVDFTIDGTVYRVENIYMPQGGSQLVYVKWKTPTSPCNMTINIIPGVGYLYNPNNSGIDNRYVNELNIDVEIFDSINENTPPDPTATDLPSAFGYNEITSANKRQGILNNNTNNKSTWSVWDCEYVVVSEETESSYSYGVIDGEALGFDDIPEMGTVYDEDTGNFITRTYKDSETIEGDGWVITTIYFYVNSFYYSFNQINYTVELINDTVEIKPSVHVPTARINPLNSTEWIMKSAYGFNVDVSSYIKVTIENTGTNVTETNNYRLLTTCPFATNAQTAYVYFPEFNYETYYRQLETPSYIGEFEFKENIYSTYRDRSHFTPIWLSDRLSDYRYIVLAKTARAYTPKGELSLYGTSNTIQLQGNVYDDWRVVPVR